MSSVSFQNIDRKPVLKNRRKLKQFILSLFAEYNIPIHSLTIIFCSDEYILSLNQQFLKHDYYTDILTFNLSVGNEMIGEIYISVDRIKDNSKNENVSFNTELSRIIFHGVLHLCGFDDKTKIQKEEMTSMENKTIESFAKFHVKQ